MSRLGTELELIHNRILAKNMAAFGPCPEKFGKAEFKVTD